MLYLFAVIALVIGVVLMLTIVVQTAEEADSEHDRHNVTRATLFILLALTLAVFVFVQQRTELGRSVKNALNY